MSTFTGFDALITFGTGVVLPSADVYSDIGLSVDLLNKSCKDYEHERWNCNNDEWVKKKIYIQNLFGWIIWIPIIINVLFTLPHFLRLEKTWTQRILTFPLLICQCWPQYRSMRVIWFAFGPRPVRNMAKCLAEKLDIEESISNLGKDNFELSHRQN